MCKIFIFSCICKTEAMLVDNLGQTKAAHEFVRGPVWFARNDGERSLR
jgi:hypothetical protein